MRVCVIGGSGFLGSHVADQLSAAGHEVLIYDRKPSPWLQTGQTMLVGDLLVFESLLEAVKGCDAVYNFAALADLNDALDKPIETIKINVLGNVNVLEACRQQGVKRFVYASTVYVYSREGGFYRCSKQAAEAYVEEYQRVFGLNYTILRYGSLYGARSNEENGVFRIVRRALEASEIVYEGHPEALREYVHVEDAARSSVEMLLPQYENQHVMLTGHKPMRVYDFLHLLGEMLGIEDRVRFIENTQPGHYVRTPYSYNPKIGLKYSSPYHVDLGQGLLHLVEEIDQMLHAERTKT